ncbi:MAG: lytic transglycosylase domain-containing protein [Micrococcales bacterium]|nr:lytic transglycosylase domain-containing protein [Micrococcales bacterium]
MIAPVDPVHLLVGALGACLLVAVGVTAGLSPQPLAAPAAPPVLAGPAGEVAPAAGPLPAGPAESPAADPAATAPASGEASTGQRASDAWVADTAAATGIPPRALQAYGDATLAVTAENPGCGLGWTTLAAIGAAESGHGTSRGTRLDADGRPLTPILGPALDGRPGFARLPADEESRRWTGDAQWQRAVGPMQFLPSTWQRWGADGDGDGSADPNDIDDAALAAGRYLCAAGGDLTTGAGWAAAVHAYNHSDAYVAQVRALAVGYAAAR